MIVPAFLDFLSHTNTVLTITTAEVMLLFIAITSLITFLIMWTFKGKTALDKLLMLRELGWMIVAGYLFLVLTTAINVQPTLRVFIYGFLAIVCIAIVVALIREHVFFEGGPSLRERWLRKKK